MRRTDPATDLVERAIRRWQISGSKNARHDLAKETEVIPAQVGEEGGISTFTVGSVAGFLGAITSLICNIAGALVLGVEPLRLLRIYATILEGRRLWDCHLVGELLRHTVVVSASSVRKSIHPHGNSNRRRCPDSLQLWPDGSTCNVCIAAGFYGPLK